LGTEPEVFVAGRGVDPAVIAAPIVVEILATAIRRRGVARWVLAGGRTPMALYARLASSHAGSVDWSRVAFYWGDERCVPPEDAESNFGRADAALLRPLGVDAAAVHRIAGEMEGAEAAAAYDRLVGDALAVGPWDLVLLGVGADGHTASVFRPPARGGGRASSLGAARAVVATAPSSPFERVTLTLAVLSRSRRVLFLVRGADKAAAVAAIRRGDPSLAASHVRPTGGRVTWCIDRSAASGDGTQESEG
jgi:6-phosphogluconolactonase